MPHLNGRSTDDELDGYDIERNPSKPEWHGMETAPRDSSWVIVLLPGGKEERAHFAQDLSGSEQPPFSGWFRESGRSFIGVPEPIGWKPAPEGDF